jgi:protein O-GlcNAc transferase
MKEPTLELAKQHFLAGRYLEAESVLKNLHQLDPDNADILQLLGVVSHSLGKSADSLPLLQRAVKLNPTKADFLCNLGLVLNACGKHEESISAFRKALKLQPLLAPAWSNLGSVQTEAGELDDAISSLRRALELQPNYPDAQCNLGNALRKAGKPVEAIAAYRQAIAQQPQHVRAYNNLGVVYQEEGLWEDALLAVKQAVALRPQYSQAYVSLGNLLQEMNRFDEAAAAFRQALSLRPNYSIAAYNMGNALHCAGRMEEAIAAFQHAISLQPDYADAYHNLANVLHGVGRLDETIDAYDRAIALRPDHSGMAGTRLYTICFHDRYDAAMILRDSQDWNRRFADPLKNEIRPHENNRDPNRKLRIGYVSPDFRRHCQAFFTIPLLSHHDHSKFEIICYADVSKMDHVSREIQKYSDGWKSTVGMSDAQVAQMIRADQVDVLVDLTMHMSAAKPLVFARKPAPVQVAWLAYPGTTGIAAMDYRLTDPYLDPAGSYDADYAEKSFRLPHTFWCYDPLKREPPVNSLPAMSNGFITFGCLNNFCKLTDPTLALWSKVLGAIPTSRLILLAPLGLHRQKVLDQLKVQPDRVEFLAFQPRPQYLQTYHRIDLGLDTFPYNGHTTSLDSLWMGVPVVSLMGKTVVSRAGFSQTSNLGLADELVAKTDDQFVEIAKKLSGDLNHLNQLRSTLRQKMERSPLMDAERFAKDIEAAYRQMWQTWCANKP